MGNKLSEQPSKPKQSTPPQPPGCVVSSPVKQAQAQKVVPWYCGYVDLVCA